MLRFVSHRQPQHLAGLSLVLLLHVLLIYAFLNGLASRRTIEASAPPLLVRPVVPDKPHIKELPPLKPTLKDAPVVGVLAPPQVDLSRPPEPPQGPPVLIEGPAKVPSVVADNGRSLETSGTGIGSGTGSSTKSAHSDCSNAASLASSIAYPAKAKRLGLQQGQVSVEFSVDAGGTIEIGEVIASNAVFEIAALDAVKNLHCSAGTYRLPISFVLQQ